MAAPDTAWFLIVSDGVGGLTVLPLDRTIIGQDPDD